MNYGIIVAAGKGERMGPNVDKAFLSLGTMPVLAYSVIAFEKCPDIDGIIIVVRKERVDTARGMVRLYGCSKVRRVVPGGTRRQESVENGLACLGDEVTVVAVHDGARPCVTPLLISQTVEMAKKNGSGVAAVKVTDTIKYVERGSTVSKTIDRSKLWAVQTPQTFKVSLLREALAHVHKKHMTVTDEASAVEALGQKVRLVPGPANNIKITSPDDLPLAVALLKL